MNSTCYGNQDTIFVQIASYRDPELQHTLQDLFKKAKRPENIFVGICHQYDMKEGSDKHLFEVPFPRPKQLRIDEIDYREAKGCCWARNRVQKLWEKEKWTLMIDSHTRFEQDWDEICISTINSLKNNGYNPVLSTYVSGYNLDGSFDKYISNTTISFFDNIGKMQGGSHVLIDNPKIGAFSSAHFCFAPAEIIRQVEYDPLLYFIGEEISLAARLWTLGYELFVPNKLILYHLYRVDRKNLNRVISTEDDIEWQSRDKVSKSRVNHLFKTLLSNDVEILSVKEYGFGKKRSLRDFERFAGVDFRKVKLRQHAKIGVFEKWYEVIKINSVKELFTKIN